MVYASRLPVSSKGARLTHMCHADTTTLDLMQLDVYWDKIMAGKPKEYHGEAINPKNLSLWERMLGRGRAYDPAAHAAQVKGIEMTKPNNNDVDGHAA